MNTDSRYLHDPGNIVWRGISQQISSNLGQDIQISGVEEIAGGDINTSFHAKSSKEAYFVKLINAEYSKMHSSEFTSLQTLAATNTIRTPKPLTTGQTGRYSFIVMEYLPLSQQGNQFELGVKLAHLHKSVNPNKSSPFGFSTDNFIGTTPQKNLPKDNWLTFWIENRLTPQIERALRNNYPKDLSVKSKALVEKIPNLFTDYAPQASLLHGDLWSGNKGFNENTPIIFDPACYFGDRETDIAMTELFGGFSSTFYAGYESVWKLDKGYKQRRTLYNLYHLLNHFNLFGSGYQGRCSNALEVLISQD